MQENQIALDSPEPGAPTAAPAPSRTHWLLRLLPLLLALAAVALAIRVLQGDSPGAGFALGNGPTSTYKLTAGDPAPEFSATALSGESISLAGLKGKPVMINFWATWCPPCRSEMPDMQQVYDAHKSDGLVVLAINVQEAPDVINRFVHQYGLTFPILLDTSGDISQTYGVQSLPTSVFIDKEGKISTYNMGALNKSAIEKRIAPTLE